MIYSALILGSVVGLLLAGDLYTKYWQNKIAPGVKIRGYEVGTLTRDQVMLVLADQKPPISEFSLSFEDQIIASSSSQLGIAYDWPGAINQAIELTTTGPWHLRIFQQIQAWRGRIDIRPNISADKEAVQEMISKLAQRVDQPGIEPQAHLAISGSKGSLTITPGSEGIVIDQATTYDVILDSLRSLRSGAVAITTPIHKQLSAEEVEFSRLRAEKYVGISISSATTPDHAPAQLSDQDLISLLQLPNEIKTDKIEERIDEWAKFINKDPQNAQFEYNPDTLEVVKFVPDKKGVQIDKSKTKDEIVKQMQLIEEGTDQSILTFTLPFAPQEAEITLESTNDLGIKELIGFGESHYDHSIPSRIHNVSVTANKINNTIVAPGEEFSFNQTLGEVSRATGFLPAYVIRNGRTELGDGGGVCQVSTTVFRAVLDAGLKVTKRRQHSYRVSYYELNAKPGIDATVYAGDVDLRFVNDTNDYLLIHTQADSEDLYMTAEIYGTSDGRTTEITNHEVWGYSPPPATQYIPDPSLPTGVKKQIDWSVSGVKAKFTNVIKDKDGNLIREDEYYSNYIPWSAKYLVGV